MLTHKHHIIPRHAGGGDEPENIIELTVEEHAEAHRKLYEEHGRKEDWLAWKGLSGQIGREEILLEIYRDNGRRQGLANKGRVAHNKGVPMSEEQKEKLRGPKSEEHKQALRKPKTDSSKMGRHERSDATRQKLSEANSRIQQDQELQERKRKKLAAKPKVTCDGCGKEFFQYRFHVHKCPVKSST